MKIYKSGLVITLISAIAATLALIILVNSLNALISVFGAMLLILILVYTYVNITRVYEGASDFNYLAFVITLIVAFATIIGFILMIIGYSKCKKELEKIDLNVKKASKMTHDEVLINASLNQQKEVRAKRRFI